MCSGDNKLSPDQKGCPGKDKKPYVKPAILMDEELRLSLCKICDSTPLDAS